MAQRFARKTYGNRRQIESVLFSQQASLGLGVAGPQYYDTHTGVPHSHSHTQPDDHQAWHLTVSTEQSHKSQCRVRDRIRNPDIRDGGFSHDSGYVAGVPLDHLNRTAMITKTINRVLKRVMGIRIVRSTDDAIPRKVPCNKHELCTVDISACKTWANQGFGLSDWNPYTQLLMQYRETPGLEHGSSVLRVLYERYRPSSLQEIYFPDEKEVIKPLNRISARCDLYSAPSPWATSHDIEGYQRSQPQDAPRSKYFGPNDETFLVREFHRTIKAYESIKEHGFQPESFSDRSEDGLIEFCPAYVRGVILFSGAEYRVIIFGGIHRMAALSALGYSRVLIRPQPGLPFVVDIGNVRNWPCVTSGVLPEGVAARIFWQYHTHNWLATARRMRLPVFGATK